MSAILEAALALKTARENEAATLEEMQTLGTRAEIKLEDVDAALHRTNAAIHARIQAEREYLQLTMGEAVSQ